jgi:hypothetical protein
MKEGKSSAKLNNNNNQQQQHQNGHLSPFKLAKLLDPEASWDKVLLSLSLSLSLSLNSILNISMQPMHTNSTLLCNLV